MGRGDAVRVLIVDDEESQRSGLESLLTAWNFSAKTAANGQEALEALATFPAHVVVTDLVMPVMDGYELLRRLAGQAGAPPIIVFTAFGSVERAVSAGRRPGRVLVSGKAHRSSRVPSAPGTRGLCGAFWWKPRACSAG